MILIRHGAGPLFGREYLPDEGAERIVFGRDPDACQVVYPADATLVGRRHFALVRELSGDWTIDLFGERYVGRNGEPAEPGDTVHPGDTFELGRPGGPGFTVVLDRGKDDGTLPATELQAPVETGAQRRRQARRVVIAASLLALLAVGGAGTFGFLLRQSNEKLATLVRKVDEAASDSIPTAVRDRLLAAAHLVYAEDGRALGTASPIAPDVLVTNSHVADLFDKLDGRKMMVRAPGQGGKRYEVISVQKHPGYEAFARFFSQDRLYINDRRVSGGDVGVYDVALLKLAPGSDAGPILTIAPPEELASLKPGTPLVMAGYPVEGIAGSEVQAEGAVPTLSTGIVTSLTDMFMMPAEVGYRLLVHHNLPSAGGSSGSPMLTPSGRLVALHNAGTYYSLGKGQPRIQNAAMIRYGQRADMLADLASGRADAAVERDREYWTRQAARFKQGIDVLVPLFVGKQKDDADNRIPAGAEPTLVSQQKGQLTGYDAFETDVEQKDERTGRTRTVRAKKRQSVFPVRLEAARPHTFAVYAQGQNRVELYLVVNGKIERQSVSNAFLQLLTFTAGENTDVQVYVAGADEDLDFTLFDYAWGRPPA